MLQVGVDPVVMLFKGPASGSKNFAFALLATAWPTATVASTPKKNKILFIVFIFDVLPTR